MRPGMAADMTDESLSLPAAILAELAISSARRA